MHARLLTFANDRVKKIDAAESTGDDWVNVSTGALEANSAALPDVREDVALAHFDQCQLRVVAVGEKVCKQCQRNRP